MRPSVKRALGLGLFAGAAYALWRALTARTHQGPLTWTPQPFPSPPRPELRQATEPVASTERNEPEPSTYLDEQPAWVVPENATCPIGYPIKTKLASGIYHEPGSANYERTHPDRCYRDAASAEADGFRPARRR